MLSLTVLMKTAFVVASILLADVQAFGNKGKFSKGGFAGSPYTGPFPRNGIGFGPDQSFVGALPRPGVVPGGVPLGPRAFTLGTDGSGLPLPGSGSPGGFPGGTGARPVGPGLIEYGGPPSGSVGLATGGSSAMSGGPGGPAGGFRGPGLGGGPGIGPGGSGGPGGPVVIPGGGEHGPPSGVEGPIQVL